MRTLEQKATDLADKIARQVRKAAGRGLAAAAKFAEGRVKEAASVKAPTRRSKSGRLYATTKATPGAPLRVVSGRFRQTITSYMVSDTEAIVGSNARSPGIENSPLVFRADVSHFGVRQRSVGRFNYPAYHEVNDYGGYSGSGQHQTFTPTLDKYMGDMATIVGSAIKVELS